MVDIYGIKIHKGINEIAFNNLLTLVAPEKKDRIKKFFINKRTWTQRG